MYIYIYIYLYMKGAGGWLGQAAEWTSAGVDINWGGGG